MFIGIELRQSNNKEPTKQGIQRNINAIQNAIHNNTQAIDFVLLIDTVSILEAIQKQLPNEEFYEDM